MNAISENETTPLETPKAMKLPRAPDSVLRVESEHDAQHAEKVKEREGNQPIKSRESYARRNERNRSAVQNLSKASSQEKSKMTLNYMSNVIDKINDSYLPANYEADKMLQKVIQLVKTKEGAKISRLPAPWREKFNSFSVDSRNYPYMDERLVIPTNLRTSIMSSIHYGHPGRDTMLRYISDIWWPKIHREVVTTAKCCDQCNNAGKNIKPLLKQKQCGEIPKSEKANDEIALDFAGPFKNAEHGKKYLLVAIDNFSAWPDALFLHKPTTKKVIEFLKNYISQYGIPKQIRSDQGTVFTSEEFKTFCRNFQINHVTCPVRDHRGNGKIKRLIRAINERLRTNKNIVLKKDKSGLSENLYALRMREKADGTSPFEKLYGRKPNTVKSNIVDKIKGVSEVDPGLKFSTSDFEEEVASAIMVRERTRGSKLEGQFRKRTGKIVKETAHTITFLPKDGKREIIYSKRDVAKTKPQKKKTPAQSRNEQAGPSTNWSATDESSEDETYVVSEETKDEESNSTPTDTTITENMEDTAESEEERESRPETNETNGEEMTIPQETAIPQEMPRHQEVVIPAENKAPGKGKKAVKASVSWAPPQRESRRRRPTERYGVDVVMKIDEENKRAKEPEIGDI